MGELYFQAHRGTYTSQAKTKRGNRKSEFALREAEMWGVAAAALTGFAFPLEQMDEAWKMVLLNQFHDIIPGSSIQRVYEEAEADYAEVIGMAAKRRPASRAALPRPTTRGADRLQLALLGAQGAGRAARGLVRRAERGGEAADHPRRSTARLVSRSTVPSCGWTTLRPAERPPRCAGRTRRRATSRAGKRTAARRRSTTRARSPASSTRRPDRELAAGPCNSFKMYKDVPTNWDAWDLDSMYEQTPVALDGTGDDRGRRQRPAGRPAPGHAQRCTTRTMTQKISLRRGSRRVDFHTMIDWQESHKLLKVNFPVRRPRQRGHARDPVRPHPPAHPQVAPL